MYEYPVVVKVPDLADSGTAKTVVEVPEGCVLSKAFVYVHAANVTGDTTHTFTLDVQKGAAGSEASMLVAAVTAHDTNDNQEIDLTPLITSGAQVAANGRVVCTMTTLGEGGDTPTGAASGVVFSLTFKRPLMPA